MQSMCKSATPLHSEDSPVLARAEYTARMSVTDRPHRRLPIFHKGSRWAVGIAALLCCAALTANVDSLADLALQDGPVPVAQDHLLLPPVPVLRAMALGDDTLVASLLWIRALAYFGEHLSTDRRYRWLDTYIDAISALDPRFRKLFQWAGVVVMYGRRIDNDAVRASIRVLEKGVELFPDDWELAFMLGCNYAFELRETDPERKRENIEVALTYLRRASYGKGAPAHVVGLVSSLYGRVGWLEAAAVYLEEAYLHADRAAIRDEIAERLKKYRSDAQIARLGSETGRFEAEWKASYPYAPQGLVRLLGPRPDGRVFDWEAFGRDPSAELDDDAALDQMMQGDELRDIGLRVGPGLEGEALPPPSAGADEQPAEGATDPGAAPEWR